MNSVVAAVIALFFVMAPVKSYDKPGEPVAIRFVQSDSQTAAQDLQIIGLKALDLPDLFKPVAATEIIDGSGKPQFQVYTFEAGVATALPPQTGPMMDPKNGTVDVASFYPQVRNAGTYILTWKTATPLVINTLTNPEAHRVLNSMPKERLATLSPQQLEQLQPVATHITPLEYALISTDKGDIKATFAYDVAPNTIGNFTHLARDKFYDGTVFHRIIKGFMIQGGDSMGTSATRAGTGGPGHSVVQEFSQKAHVRGVLSMARSQEPDSAGSQFFIMLADKTHLNGGYTAFGQVIDGMNIVDKIAETPTIPDPDGTENGATKPEVRPAIKSIRILPATAEMYGIKK